MTYVLSCAAEDLRRAVVRTLRQERRHHGDRRQEATSLLDRIEQKRLALERDRRTDTRRAADRGQSKN